MKIRISYATNNHGARVTHVVKLPWDRDEGFNENDIDRFAFEYVKEQIHWSWEYDTVEDKKKVRGV